MRLLVIFLALAFMWGAGVLAGVLWCERDDDIDDTQDALGLENENNGRG